MIDIRPIRNTDIDACYKIVRTNWSSAVADRFLSEVDQINSDFMWPPIYYVAVVDGSVVGFAGMIQSWILNGIWDFIWINVHKDFQKSRIGKALTEHRIKEVLRCDGRVIQLMTKSPLYFEQFGFTVVKNYGEWNLMTLWLGPVEI